ncbi:MAG TPA: ion transporter [Oscillatoriaceae cyanobacterium M33_DOE_052]|uniref:Ion transporter n=1 Tax=Planktothricoides sp. SpSt-374 TaxID=2282167 RepID=A0A7C3VNN4_9CYAN|nr:ion transporter [Oscillatoriaceae cyanobacterium M33_DOE_052]
MLTREKIVYYLESDESSVAKWVNLIVPALVLLSSAIFVAETHPIDPELKSVLTQINAIILLIFALEYAIRFWCAENKLTFFFSFYSIIDLLVILPFFVKAFDFSFILIFRWFRILRLLRFIETQTFFGSIDREDGTILARILFTLFAIIFVYSGLIYQVEHPVNPEDFTTFFDAFYFSVVTMTTVGFGDVTPLSPWGRLMTVMMILTGVALIPWQVGDLIKQLIKTAHKVERECGVCRLSFHDTDAKFCKRCGAELLPPDEG